MLLKPERRPVIFILLLIVATCAVYSNTLHNAYQLDDEYRIVDNPELERVWPPWRHFLDARTSSTLPTLTQYRPLLPLSLSVNHWISDMLGADRLVALHVGNITIHATTTVLLFLAFCRLLALAQPTSVFSESRRRWTALFAALVWTVHPVSGIPVNYLSARDLLLMQLFLVAALLVWLRLRLDGESVMRLMGFSLLAALSVLSKETGVALVPLILLLELLLLRDRPFGRSLRWWIGGWVGLSAVYLLVQAKKVAGWLSPDYAWIQLEVHLSYLRNVFWPFKARLLAQVDPPKMPFDLVALAGAAVIVASLYLAWRWRRSLPLYSFCIAGYWALLAPSSSVLTLSELANDYRPYPALACIFLLLVSLLFARLPGRPAVLLAAGAVLYFGVSGFVMNRNWISSERFYSHIVRHGGTGLAHLNLARQLKDPAEAEYHYQKVLKLEPRNVYAHINLGLLLIDVGRSDEGVALVERGVELQPQWAMSHYWMSRTYEWVGR